MEGMLISNENVPKALAQWEMIGVKGGDAVRGNWRYQLYYFRAMFDVYIQSRLVYESELETRATAALAKAPSVGSEAAMSEAESNLVKFGNYTSVVVLMNDDYDVVQEDARKVVKAIMNAGYGARVEGPNAVEAYLGSIPGHHRQNVRRPLLHTLSLSDMLPITSIWAGLEHNPCDFYPKNSPALCYAATTGSTPFRVNLHVGEFFGRRLGQAVLQALGHGAQGATDGVAAGREQLPQHQRDELALP